MTYCVYILYSTGYDKFYVGSTNNPSLRLIQHNSGKYGWAKAYRPWELIHTETFSTRSEAMRREKYLKSLKDKDILRRLINKSSSPK